MTQKKTQTLYHPSFPDTTREVEGADEINRYTAQGWLTSAPKKTTTALATEADASTHTTAEAGK